MECESGIMILRPGDKLSTEDKILEQKKRVKILQNKRKGEAGNQEVPVPGLTENVGIFILARYSRIQLSCIFAEKKNEYSKSFLNILSARNLHYLVLLNLCVMQADN